MARRHDPEREPRSWYQCTEVQRQARCSRVAAEIARLLSTTTQERHGSILAAAVQLAQSPNAIRFGVAAVAAGYAFRVDALKGQ